MQEFGSRIRNKFLNKDSYEVGSGALRQLNYRKPIKEPFYGIKEITWGLYFPNDDLIHVGREDIAGFWLRTWYPRDIQYNIVEDQIRQDFLVDFRGRNVLGFRQKLDKYGRSKGYISAFTALDPQELADTFQRGLPNRMHKAEWFNPRQVIVDNFRLKPLLPEGWTSK